MSKPILTIIGRPNVGKSTLYNRIVRKRDAIVDDQPGGYLPDSENLILQAVLTQVHQAIAEADVIAYVVDVTTGITSIDEEIARILNRNNQPVVLAVNKVDNEIRELDCGEFYRLGLGDPVPISAISGRNVGDFLDKVIAAFPDSKKGNIESQPPEIKI